MSTEIVYEAELVSIQSSLGGRFPEISNSFQKFPFPRQSCFGAKECDRNEIIKVFSNHFTFSGRRERTYLGANKWCAHSPVCGEHHAVANSKHYVANLSLILNQFSHIIMHLEHDTRLLLEQG